MEYKIGVVLVTFNRLSKLKKALQCYSNQSALPSYIIIVDNASSDGTDIFLDEWLHNDEHFEKIVLKLPQNIGGSGGFYEGLKKALQKDAEWIWVADDDAYPSKNSFSIALDFIYTHQLDDIAALCGSVLFNEKICLKHRRRTFSKFLNFHSEPVPEKEYCSDFLLNTCSFVGSIFSKDKIKIAGLPKKDYFIWYDDSEYSLRMSKFGKIICLPQIEIIHDENIDSRVFSWKTYYGIRNYLDLIRSNFSPFIFITQIIIIVAYSLKRFFHNKEETVLYITAIKDALMQNFGLHPKYRPGWKIN